MPTLLVAESTVEVEPVPVSTRVPIRLPRDAPAVPGFEGLVSRLHESHDVSVYEAIERRVQAGEAVGLRMLGQGMTFEALLEGIEARMECSRSAA